MSERAPLDISGGQLTPLTPPGCATDVNINVKVHIINYTDIVNMD